MEVEVAKVKHLRLLLDDCFFIQFEDRIVGNVVFRSIAQSIAQSIVFFMNSTIHMFGIFAMCRELRVGDWI